MMQRQRVADHLRDCSKKLSLVNGSQAHAWLLRSGFDSDQMLNNDLIHMYGKCGRTDLADYMFDKMPHRNVVSWTSLMCAHLQTENAHKCLALFRRMRGSDAQPNEFTLSTSAKACGMMGVAGNGTQIHALCAKSGFERAVVVGNSIIDMYAKFGRFGDSFKMFFIMPVRSLVTWNVIIAKCTEAGHGKRALLSFREMQGCGEVPDEFSFSSALKACSVLGAFREGRELHASVIVRGYSGPFQTAVIGALVDMYVKCELLHEARKVFDRIKEKNVVSWSSMILGYVQEGDLKEATNLFGELRQSSDGEIDGFALSSMIGAFADFALVEQGRQIHALAVKTLSCLETSVANSILDMYLKCGMLQESEKFFSRMVKKDVFSWTIMITGYGKHGLGRQAIDLFNEMQLENIKVDYVAYLAVLTACSHSGLIDDGREIFSKLLNDPRVKPKVEHYACIVDLLGRAGRITEAKSLVENMPMKPNPGIYQSLLSACKVHGSVQIAREVGDRLLRLDGNNTVNYVMLSNVFAEAGEWRECEQLRRIVKVKGLKKEGGQSWVEIDKVVHFFYNRDDAHPLINEIHGFLREMERRMKAEIGYVPGLKFAMHDVDDESKEESLRAHSEKLAIGLALVCGGTDGTRMVRVFKNLRVCGDCHSFIKGLSKLLKMVFLVRDANRFHKFEDGLCSCGDYCNESSETNKKKSASSHHERNGNDAVSDDESIKETNSLLRQVHRAIFDEQVFDLVNREAFSPSLGVNVTVIRENYLQLSIGQGNSVFILPVPSGQSGQTANGNENEDVMA